MPGRNPFLIAKEYAQAGEVPQVRKNALTALAALDDADSRALLAEVALTDSDPEVREKAEAEIALMSSESARGVLDIILVELGRPERERGAYVLLGKLRNRGMPFEFPHMPIAARLRLAKSMRDHLYPKRGVKFYLRTLGGTLAGVSLAWLVLVAYCNAMLKVDLDGATVLGYFFLGWMLAMVIAACSTFLSSPARLYADLKGGALLDILMAAVSSLGVAGVAVAISVTGDKKGLGWRPQYLLLFVAPFVAAAVRAGTVAVFGWAKSKRLNRLIQTAVGGSCGLATYSLVLMATGYTGDHFLAQAWAMIVPGSYGLAAAFAWIDSGSRAHPVSSLFEKASALGVTLAVPLLGLFILIPLPGSARIDRGVISAPAMQRVELKAVPRKGATITFQTASDCWLSTRFLDQESEVNFAAHLIRSQEGKDAELTSTFGEVKLKAGEQYKIRIDQRPEESVDILEAVPQLVNHLSWAQLEARVLRRPPLNLPVLVSVEMGFDSTFSISASPTSQSINPEQVAKYTVTLAAENGYKGVVSVDCKADSFWLNCTASPASLSVAAPTSVVAVHVTGAFITKGSHSLTLTGTALFMNSPRGSPHQDFTTTALLVVK